MIAIILIALMLVAIVTSELIMRCSPENEEGVKSPAEIAGD
jgi:hypothetical protein